MNQWLKILISILCLFGIIFLPIGTQAVSASESAIPNEIRTQAIEIAQQIEKESLFLSDHKSSQRSDLDGLSQEQRLLKLHQMAIGAVMLSNDLTLKDVVDLHDKHITKMSSLRNRRFNALLKSFALIFDPANAQSNIPDIERTLLPFTEDADWYISHYAWLFLSLANSYNLSISIALEQAQEAHKLIPEEVSTEATFANIESTAHITYLQVLLIIPELAVPNTAKLIEIKKKAGQEIDGAGLINDLIFCFSSWRDFETANALSEILLRLEAKSVSPTPGLTGLRVALTYNQLNEYEKSLPHIRAALDVVTIKSIEANLRLQRAIAYAGLQNVKKAESALHEFENLTSDDVKSKGSLPRQTVRAQALIALARGKTKKADKLNQKYINMTVESILKFNNQETSTMLASLQNSKDRQDEREASLKREAELKQDALHKQESINRLLILVLCGLLVTVVAAMAFARYRSRIAAKMQVAAEKALLGEKAKSEFLAVMSHELRTPLNGVLGMADMLVREGHSSAVTSKSEIILKSGQDLLGLVENILDMTLIEAGDLALYPDMTNVNEVVRSIEREWRPFIEEKDIQFTLFLDPKIPEEIFVDKGQLSKTLTHLVSNSAKFTMVGRIHLHITSETVSSPGKYELKFIIADTGAGISEDAQAVMFEHFVQADNSMTRQFGGAGLGLSIARSIARMMGGDITFITREGRGSEFTLVIRGDIKDPSCKDIPAEISVQARALPPVKGITQQRGADEKAVAAIAPCKILVVEDDLSCQKVLQTLLENSDCRVSCASTGQAGLAALSMEMFDIVIMDIRMPGMDGVTAIRHIRAGHQPRKDIPIIALTAEASAETSARCLQAGVNAFLTKPVKAAELLSTIAQLQDMDTASAPQDEIMTEETGKRGAA